MTISEVARAAGVSPKAIRVWEAKGLIPTAPRTEAGYRTFAESDLARLQFIRQSKAIGLTLDEIRNVIVLRDAGTSPCARVLEAIDAHLRTIERSIAELVQLQQTLIKAKSAGGTTCPGRDRTEFCQIIETMGRDARSSALGLELEISASS